MKRSIITAAAIAAIWLTAARVAHADSGVYVRFKLEKPQNVKWHVRLGGYIHQPNWYLPRGVVPEGADKSADQRLNSGEYSDWFDVKAWAGDALHGRMDRAGGVAEFPNVTAQFVADGNHPERRVVIELATTPDAAKIVKRFEETFAGDLTSFLVSPNLAADADDLETASQMTDRRLSWATAATGGERRSPKRLIIQTSFWGPQRRELNLKEARTLWLLGFNVVGNQQPYVHEAMPELRVPGHTHHVAFGPAATREQIDKLMAGHASKITQRVEPGVPFGFTDEIAARPPIGDNANALAHFRSWLKDQGIKPSDLGVSSLDEVQPLETPDALKAAMKSNESAARRVFYYTSRFRQLAGTERIRWHTESYHQHFGDDAGWTSTLVADHPYFGGTGLGMGMDQQNFTWEGWPLALDWFDLARRRAVDLIGIEDWMGLQYMYGPNSTWEGFQLMGFQAAMMRSGSRGELPIIAWITPSDETNLRLKTHSALCQGAKHFFYWTYGPTATSTENYWSDLRGSYDGIARVTKQLAAAEDIIAPGKMRPTKVALLYSISSDLWQPFGYIHMLERRGTYLSLVHDQYKVDMLTEEDIEEGRLDDYAVLYATDPCITGKATAAIREWVKGGGYLYGSCAAGTRNEFGEKVDGLADVFGIEPKPAETVQPGEYRIRGRLNGLTHIDRVSVKRDDEPALAEFGVIGVKSSITPTSDSETIGRFSDGSPAVVGQRFGKGRAMIVATTPGVSYIKDAKFVPDQLAEKWPADHRRFINIAAAAEATPGVQLSEPIVEAGVYDAEAGTALVLANFTYEPIETLRVTIAVPRRVKSVHSASTPKDAIEFDVREIPGNHRSGGMTHLVTFTTPLGLDDIILLR